MSTQTIHRLVDDMTGEDADETVRYALDGTTYEIDLSAQNAETFRKALADYVDNSRRVARSRVGKPKSITPAPGVRKPALMDPAQRAAIRDWANGNGWPVGKQGRLPQSVIDAYEDAHR